MEVETEGWLFRDRKSPVLLVIDLFSHRQAPGLIPEQGLIRLIKEIRGTMSSLRDARVANLDCRLIKKKKKRKNSFPRAHLRTDFHPPEIALSPVSFKDVDDEISKDFAQISRF